MSSRIAQTAELQGIAQPGRWSSRDTDRDQVFGIESMMSHHHRLGIGQRQQCGALPLEMIGQLRDGDVVVVWKIDRLSRSLKDMLHIMERIELAGAGFRSLTEAIDTTAAAGRMMMQMIGSFAEFERAMIRERTSAGLAQARAEGRIGGRRRKLAEKQRREIAESVVSGRKSGAEMARLYGVSEPTVSRIVAAHRQSIEVTAA